MHQHFSTVEWAYHTNIYEVNLRQYTEEGTLKAFVTHLPRLRDMGVETLWLMPLQPIGKLNRKGTLGSYYSISDYTALNPEYGTLDDFKNLVEQAQALGMKVIIDWVANHTAWDHVWTKSHPDFFSKDENGNFRPPYPDWADVIHLDYHNHDLWQAMIEAMAFWVKNFDIDGFRCDMAHLVRLEFWSHARAELEKLKKLFWLAETEDPRYHEVFDASYTWEFLHAMEAFWRNETSMEGLFAVLQRYKSHFPENALRLFFTSNHDENSHSGSEYERLGEAAKAFAVLCALWNGIPLVYCGQELPNKKRLKFFEKDTIKWKEKNELHDFYKTLLQLHARHPALGAADEETIPGRLQTSHPDKIFAYLRKKGERVVLVLLNLSPYSIECTIPDERMSGFYKNVFTGEEICMSSDTKISLRPWHWLVGSK
jgi:glycosidase